MSANINTSQENDERHTAIIKKKGRKRYSMVQGPSFTRCCGCGGIDLRVGQDRETAVSAFGLWAITTLDVGIVRLVERLILVIVLRPGKSPGSANRERSREAVINNDLMTMPFVAVMIRVQPSNGIFKERSFMKHRFPIAFLSLILIFICSSAAWPQKASLPFIEDDYAQALAQARQRGLPLFVEVWAPWCHTCRYMRAYVFSDAALTKHAGRFAWLAIDSEQPKNSAFVEKFPFDGLPMFLIVDPKAEQVVLKWYGSATVEQIAGLLDDGARAWKGGGEASETLLARADRLNGEGNTVEAARAYREAIQGGGPNWSGRERAAESLVMAFLVTERPEECARAALDLAPGLRRGRSFLNAVDSGLSCALEGGKAEWAVSAVAKLKPLEEEALRLPNQLADDRAAVYNTLIGLNEKQNNQEAAKKLTAEFASFLDNQEKTAPNAEARASLDSYRAMLAIHMKEPRRAIPALQASERDLPNDYNPPARLAILYSEMGWYDEALAANDRALAKVYGPRRIQVLSSRSSIYEKKGDKAAARAAIEEAIRLVSSQPKSERQLASLKKRLDNLK